MKSFKERFRSKTSLIEVLSPFVKIYNFFGICMINVNAENFKLSRVAVVSLVLNILYGLNFMYYAFTISSIKIINFQVLGFGVKLILYVGVSSSLLTLLSNFLSRESFRKLLQAFIKFDSQAADLFELNHNRQFFILLMFWIVRTLYFMMRLTNEKLANIVNLTYVTISFFIPNEVPVCLLFLGVYRLRLARMKLGNVSACYQSNHNSRAKAKIKALKILLLQNFEVFEILSKTFGFQMMIFWTSSLFIGMFTIFTAFQMLFISSSVALSFVFHSYIQYAIYDHVLMLVICVLNSIVSKEVRLKLI